MGLKRSLNINCREIWQAARIKVSIKGEGVHGIGFSLPSLPARLKIMSTFIYVRSESDIVMGQLNLFGNIQLNFAILIKIMMLI